MVKRNWCLWMDNLNMQGDVPLPGSAKFRDVVGDDNNITTDDRTYIGNSEPKFTGGFVNKFNYKGFDLNIFLSFSYGVNCL